jgi:hypothetical protein
MSAAGMLGVLVLLDRAGMEMAAHRGPWGRTEPRAPHLGPDLCEVSPELKSPAAREPDQAQNEDQLQKGPDPQGLEQHVHLFPPAGIDL